MSDEKPPTEDEIKKRALLRMMTAQHRPQRPTPARPRRPRLDARIGEAIMDEPERPEYDVQFGEAIMDPEPGASPSFDVSFGEAIYDDPRDDPRRRR